MATLLAPSLDTPKPLSSAVCGALALAPLVMTGVMALRFAICAERRDRLRLWIAPGLGTLDTAGAALVASLTDVGRLTGAALGLVCLAPWWALHIGVDGVVVCTNQARRPPAGPLDPRRERGAVDAAD